MASSADMALNLLLKLKDEASEKLGGIKDKLGGVKMAALGIAGAAVAGVGALAAGLISAGNAAAEEQVGIERLGAAVRASGGNWDEASVAIEDYLSAELRRTALDDGAGREAISRLTTATGDYRQALDLMGLTQDLAAAKGMDLASAAELVGKVANGNTSALSRYGIVLEEGATAQEALAAMQQRFAGQAEAYGNTTVGAQQRMQIALGNLKETVGGMVLPVMTRLAEAGADLAQRALPIVEQAVTQLRPVFEQVFAWVKDNVVPILTQIVQYVIDNWPKVRDTIVPILQQVWDIIQTVVGAIVVFWTDNHDRIMAVVNAAWGVIKNTVSLAINIVRGVISTVLALVRGDWEGAWESIKQLAVDIWNGIKGAIEGQLNTILAIFGTNLEDLKAEATTKFNEVVARIKTALDIDWGQLGKNIVQGIANGLGAFAGLLVDAARNLANQALSAIKNLFGIHSPSEVMKDEVGKPIVEGVAEGILVYGGIVADAMQEIIVSAIVAGRETVKAVGPIIAAASEEMLGISRLGAKTGGIVTAEGTETLEGGGVSASDIIPSGRKGGGTPNAPAEEPTGSTGGYTGTGTSELIIRLYWNDNEAGEVTASLIDGERKSVTLNVVAGVL